MEDAGDKIEVMLEPFDMPRMVVSYSEQGTLSISKSNDDATNLFHVVPGLDNKKGIVSLMTPMWKAVMFIANYESDFTIKISCKNESTDADFDKRANFVMKTGISSYHPMSFVLEGKNRNFLLMPLFSLSDEYYTVYFNIQS